MDEQETGRLLKRVEQLEAEVNQLRYAMWQLAAQWQHPPYQLNHQARPPHLKLCLGQCSNPTTASTARCISAPPAGYGASVDHLRCNAKRRAGESTKLA